MFLGFLRAGNLVVLFISDEKLLLTMPLQEKHFRICIIIVLLNVFGIICVTLCRDICWLHTRLT